MFNFEFLVVGSDWNTGVIFRQTTRPEATTDAFRTLYDYPILDPTKLNLVEITIKNGKFFSKKKKM